MIQAHLCECHPKKLWFGCLRFIAYEYEQVGQLKAAGKICFVLARPHKGFHDHGWYVNIGTLLIAFTPFRDEEV